MANIKLSVNYATFVNWYFNVENADAINADFLRECGFDESYFDFDTLGENGTHICDANEFADVIRKHYDETAKIGFIPCKMGTYAVITFSDGVSYGCDVNDDDEFIQSQKHENKQKVCNYKGFDIYTVFVCGSPLYCTALFDKHPDYYTYFATWDDVTKQIDFRTRNDR